MNNTAMTYYEVNSNNPLIIRKFDTQQQAENYHAEMMKRYPKAKIYIFETRFLKGGKQ